MSLIAPVCIYAKYISIYTLEFEQSTLLYRLVTSFMWLTNRFDIVLLLDIYWRMVTMATRKY